MTARRSEKTPTVADTAETAYVCHGDAGAPVMIFIHGVGMNKASWQAQMQAFATDYRVIAYDMLGHGDSALPPESVGVSDLTAQLVRLMDRLEIDRAHIIGHSMGALVATELALTHPERVTRLVALNAVYQRSDDKREAVVSRAESIARGEVSHDNEATIERWFTAKERQQAPAAVEQIRQWLSAVNQTGYARIYRAFATSDRLFTGRLHTLRLPALFMTGAEDPNSTPDMSQQLAAEAVNAQCQILPGQRHMMAYIAPAIVNARIRAFMETTF